MTGRLALVIAWEDPRPYTMTMVLDAIALAGLLADLDDTAIPVGTVVHCPPYATVGVVVGHLAGRVHDVRWDVTADTPDYLRATDQFARRELRWAP